MFDEGNSLPDPSADFSQKVSSGFTKKWSAAHAKVAVVVLVPALQALPRMASDWQGSSTIAYLSAALLKVA